MKLKLVTSMSAVAALSLALGGCWGEKKAEEHKADAAKEMKAEVEAKIDATEHKVEAAAAQHKADEHKAAEHKAEQAAAEHKIEANISEQKAEETAAPAAEEKK